MCQPEMANFIRCFTCIYGRHFPNPNPIWNPGLVAFQTRNPVLGKKAPGLEYKRSRHLSLKRFIFTSIFMLQNAFGNRASPRPSAPPYPLAGLKERGRKEAKGVGKRRGRKGEVVVGRRTCAPRDREFDSREFNFRPVHCRIA